MVELCKLTGDDPANVIVQLHGMRAANDEVTRVWETVAKRLGALTAWVFACVIGTGALTHSDQAAAASATTSATPSVYYVKCLALLVALATGLGYYLADALGGTAGFLGTVLALRLLGRVYRLALRKHLQLQAR